MGKIKLKMHRGKDCWDNLTLIIPRETGVIPLIRFQNRNSALDAYRQIVIANYENHIGKLVVTIDSIDHTFTQPEWEAVLDCLDQWYEEYMMVVETVGVN